MSPPEPSNRHIPIIFNKPVTHSIESGMRHPGIFGVDGQLPSLIRKFWEATAAQVSHFVRCVSPVQELRGALTC